MENRILNIFEKLQEQIKQLELNKKVTPLLHEGEIIALKKMIQYLEMIIKNY
jgi:hypothetical protein